MLERRLVQRKGQVLQQRCHLDQLQAVHRRIFAEGDPSLPDAQIAPRWVITPFIGRPKWRSRRFLVVARPMIIRDGGLHLMAHLNSCLPVVGHSGDLFLRRGELFLDRTDFLTQLVHRNRRRIEFSVSL